MRNLSLTFDKEKHLLDACIGRRTHLKPILIWSLDMAMRIGEILRLQWSDVKSNRFSGRCVYQKIVSDS